MSDSGAPRPISNRTRSRSAKTQEKREEVEDNADLVSGEGSDVEVESGSDSVGATVEFCCCYVVGLMDTQVSPSEDPECGSEKC